MTHFEWVEKYKGSKFLAEVFDLFEPNEIQSTANTKESHDINKSKSKKMKKNFLKGVPVGTKVFSIKYGWGKIVKINKEECIHIINYPIEVEFKTATCYFNFDGKYLIADAMPSLFLRKPKFSKKLFKLPEPKLNIDDPVIVWENSDKKYKRHFAKFNGEKIYCYNSGMTSFTNTMEVVAWSNWEKVQS